MLKHASIADIPEGKLIEMLANDQHWRSRISGMKGIPDGSILYRSTLMNELTGPSQGDVDVLLVPPGRPECATAIEVKRIKVGAKALRRQSPNKIHEFRRGINQANELTEIGFWQVYLYVFVVVDSRESNSGRYTFDGLPRSLGRKIRDVITPDGLNDRAGLMHYEFVQPMDDVPLGMGAFSANLIRLAKPAKQPSCLTDWVAHVMTAGNRRS